MIFNEKTKKWESPYWHPAVTTDAVVFGFDKEEKSLQVLLIKRGKAKSGETPAFEGYWALPGGFLRMDETALEGAKRELFEETGLKDAYIQQFHTYTDPQRDIRDGARVITIAYYALVKNSEVKGGDDAAKAQWFPCDKVPSLAFDHLMILREAEKALRRQIHFEPIGFELLPEPFTMTELQRLYEAILDVKFDRRNFCNKMLKLGILNHLEETRLMPNKKEAFLYTFNPESYSELKDKGFRLEF